ncbi:MAG: YbgC/FadM family acyl-CoA thioesterase [Rhodoferax sp.]|uniref:YbgC/FadM family acyl-CoA thioesterase n=1 Tax=Rhodoferax sp. TaxID=50421 RepID=UPI00271912CC|nr:YbgC/FadM family acyl-CoA thioesterase [Rhodoferax sp.]MDO8450005.1 YbgC/FadM family acyl-CoA thioesterase [Rhodoferax sp.]
MTDATRQDFRFFHRLRVRWAEVDMQKIVFNAHYLMYFDTAMADYWRALALPYDTTMQALEGDIYVKKATVEFHASARVDDQLDVALKCSRIGTSSMVFTGAIFRGDDHLISCELIYVFADPATQTSRPVPIALCDILTGYEAWEPMARVELGTWQALGAAARKVRTEVFLEEQRIPVEMEWDEADDTAVHALARNRLGLPVATGRLLQHAPGVGRIGRMAVNRVLRGSNLGRDVLRALMQAAADRGDREVLLHAQRNAEGFYARLGFLPRGEPFEEAGIVHIEMVHALPPGYQALVGTA